MIMSETQEQQRRETKRQKHKWNGEIEGKWNDKTYDGGWEMSRHLEGDVLQDECVGRHLRTSQITQDKTSNLRRHKPH